MPSAEWRATKATLHRFCQVVGKIRLASAVRRNHWWNAPFHVTGQGIKCSAWSRSLRSRRRLIGDSVEPRNGVPNRADQSRAPGR
ncbi:DUF5996 family protein [Nonomuraea sp. NPDC049480]|uniref:DUF5996 family protein n=1 Tax=Nonomuraea sp. NPDC049480 TaxID=3364353 RepID=UPI003793D5FB